MDPQKIAQYADDAAVALGKLQAVLPEPKPKFGKSIEVLTHLANAAGDSHKVPELEILPKALRAALRGTKATLRRALREQVDPRMADLPPVARLIIEAWAQAVGASGGSKKSATKSARSRQTMIALNQKREERRLAALSLRAPSSEG